MKKKFSQILIEQGVIDQIVIQSKMNETKSQIRKINIGFGILIAIVIIVVTALLILTN